jgi:hypothetical protein
MEPTGYNEALSRYRTSLTIGALADAELALIDAVKLRPCDEALPQLQAWLHAVRSEKNYQESPIWKVLNRWGIRKAVSS